MNNLFLLVKNVQKYFHFILSVLITIIKIIDLHSLSMEMHINLTVRTK